MRYVCESEILGLALHPREVRAAVADALVQRAQGRASLVPKVGVYPPTGGLFHAMPAAIEDLVVVKWLAAGPAPRPGAPALQSTILATDPLTGELLAVLDGAWLTGLRTAAVTALALELLRPGLRVGRAAFIGAGLQARSHLQALQDLVTLQSATVMAGRPSSADAFLGLLAERGVAGSVEADPRRAVADADIVITAVPFLDGVVPFVDAGWLLPTAFASAVDLGRAWIAASYGAFTTTVTDDLEHSRAFLASGLVAAAPRLDADLPMLLSAGPGAAAPAPGRTLLFAPGVALADAAVARLVLRKLGLLG